jgi:hypothetical protein
VDSGDNAAAAVDVGQVHDEGHEVKVNDVELYHSYGYSCRTSEWPMRSAND